MEFKIVDINKRADYAVSVTDDNTNLIRPIESLNLSYYPC